MQKIENVLAHIERFKNLGDGTYNMNTGEPVEYPIGYQVSFVRPEAFAQLNNQNWDTITNYLCGYLDSLAHIGVYCGEAEVSFHSVSKDKAVEIMERYNQESILDWEKKIAQPQPEFWMDWLIFNRLFDEKKVVNYDKILEEIQ